MRSVMTVERKATGMSGGSARSGMAAGHVVAARLPVLVWTVLLAGAALLMVLPQPDHWAARLFYQPESGFPAELDATLQLIRDLAIWPGYLLLGVMGVSLAHRLFRGRYLLGLDRRAIVYLTGVAAIGIGLIANALLKENWGRARPRQTIEYGGTAEYTPPLLIADQCQANCSFVAGEGAYGFFWLALGFIASRRWQPWVFAAAMAFGSGVGLIRIAMGAHYLSDVYFAALVMLSVSWFFYRYVVVKDVTGPVARALPVRRTRSSASHRPRR